MDTSNIERALSGAFIQGLRSALLHFHIMQQITRAAISNTWSSSSLLNNSISKVSLMLSRLRCLITWINISNTNTWELTSRLELNSRISMAMLRGSHHFKLFHKKCGDTHLLLDTQNHSITTSRNSSNQCWNKRKTSTRLRLSNLWEEKDLSNQITAAVWVVQDAKDSARKSISRIQITRTVLGIQLESQDMEF
jgi:hypothetical protein